MKKFEKRLNRLAKDLEKDGVSFLLFFGKPREEDNNKIDIHTLADGETDVIATAIVGSAADHNAQKLVDLLRTCADMIEKRN